MSYRSHKSQDTVLCQVLSREQQSRSCWMFEQENRAVRLSYVLCVHFVVSLTHSLTNDAQQNAWCEYTGTGDIVQEYNHHLAPVNTVTFVDQNRKFVSTSDDKKILVWEMNVPVPVKYITDPTMHSIPAVTERPGGKFIVGQSLDNQILTFNSGARVKPYKKRFSGHIIAGFACQLGFSPNGQYLMSGDGDGRLWFWDWKSSKVYRKIRAHNDGPCIGCKWHPIDPSRVFTCGWDGTIKEWE